MADAQANINVNINATQALSQIRALQKQISMFHSSMARGNAQAASESLALQRNLVNSINATGQFSARMATVATSTESFTNALEKNKLSMGEYFRYAGGASKTFSRMFGKEFDLVNRTAIERVKTLQTQYIKMGRDANGAMKSIAVRPLTLDMNNLATQTAIAAQRQQLFNQLLKQGSTNLLNWGKNTQWAGRQLMVGFTIPLSIMAGVAIQEFRKIEEQAIKFRRVYGDMFTTDAETEQALDNIRRLADEFTRYGIAVESTIGLAAKVAQMGNVGRALEEQVTQATRLSVLGGLEQEEALDTTISLTNAFGVSIEELADKINLLNAAENQTILSIEDFNEAIPKAGTVVRQLGGDVEDLAVFLTAMREGGINASEAGNALKTSLGRLINPTRQARQDLAALGIDVVGIVETNAGNLRQTVFDLAFALDQLDPLERSRAIERLFGKFQFTRMSTLLQNITDTGSQANRMLQITAQSSAQLGILAERELARVEESSATKLQKSIETLQASLAPLGEQFVKLLIPIVEWGTKILEKFNEMGDGGKQMVVGIIAVLGLVAPAVLMTVGLIANGIANLTKFFIMISNGYRRLISFGTGAATNTQYLTNEQLRAQAVANTLGGAHDALTASFNVENTALRNLITTYQAAIIAQGNLARSAQGTAAAMAAAAPTRGLIIPGGGRTGGTARSASDLRLPGYNKGILSVPGPKGAGDVVPALLSPGEAVIPARAAGEYAPIIKGMISGNIQKFSSGGIVSESDYVFKDSGGKELGKVVVNEKARKELAQMMSFLEENPEKQSRTVREILAASRNGKITTEILADLRRSDPYFYTAGYAGARGNKGLVATHATAQIKIGDPRELESIAPFLSDKAGPGQTSSRAKLLAAIARGEKATLVSNLVYGLPGAANQGAMTGNEIAAYVRANPKDFTRFLSDTYKIPQNDPGFQSLRSTFAQTMSSKFGDRLVSEADLVRTNPSILKQAIYDNEKVVARTKNAFADAEKIRGIRAGRVGELYFDKAKLGSTISTGQRQIQLGGVFDTGEIGPDGQPKKETVSSYTKARELQRKSAQRSGQPSAYQLANQSADDFAKNASLARAGIRPVGSGAASSPTPLSEMTSAERNTAVRKEQKLQEQVATKTGAGYRAGLVKGAGTDLAQGILREGGWRSPNPTITGAGFDDGEGYGKNFITGARKSAGSATSGADLLLPGRPTPPPAGARPGSSLILPGMPQQPGAATSSTGLVIPRTSGGIPVPIGVGAPQPPVPDPAQTKGRAFWGRVGTAVSNGAAKASAATAPARDRLMNSVLRPLGREIDRRVEGRITAAGSRGDERIANANQQIRQQRREERAAQRAQRGGMGGGGMGMGLSIAGGAAIMGLSMSEGKTGDFVRENMGMLYALTSLPILLPLLKNPIMALVAAIGAGVAAFLFFKSEVNKAAKSGQELASAMSMSSERIQEISEFTGTVSATQLRQRRNEQLMIGGDQETRQFGMSFLESDPGKQLTEDLEKMQEAGMTSNEIGASIGRNLTSAILQGVLDPQQAFSIAAALGTALQDYTIPAQIVGQINSFIGPNGENLETDPIKIALDVQQETIADQQAFDDYAQQLMMANDQARVEANRGWEDTAVIIGSTISGISAGVGLAAGWTGVGAAIAGVGLAIGGVIGLAGAMQKGLNEQDDPTLWDRYKENIELRNASIALGVEALSQTQQTLDIIDNQYYTELARLDLLEQEAETEDDLLDIEIQRTELSERRAAARQDALAQNQELMANLLEQESRLDPGQFSAGLLQAIQTRYEGSIGLPFFEDAFNQLEELRIEAEDLGDVEQKEFAIRIQTELAAGNLSYTTAYKLMEAFAADEDFSLDFNAFINKTGSAEASTIIDLLDKANVSPDKYNIFFDIIVNAEDMDVATRALSALADVEIKFGIPVEIDEESMTRMQEELNIIDQEIGDSTSITREQALQAPEGSALREFGENWEELAGDLESVSPTAVVQFAALIAADDLALINWFRTQQGQAPLSISGVPPGRTGVGGVSGITQEETVEAGVEAFGTLPPAASGTGTPVTEEPTPTGSGGGGDSGSILDPIVKDMRDFMNISQQATKGWEASLDAIIKFGKEGAKSMGGLSNQLRRVGVSEGLIEKFLGMDPEEWEKRKGELFKFDVAGNITGITEAGKAVQEAFNETIIAKAIDKQQNLANTTRDQIVAIKRLRDAGADFKSAYQLVQDTALATAIATGKNTKAIKELVKEAKEAAALVAELEEMNEEEQRRERLKESLEDLNKQFNQRVQALKKIQQQAGRFSDEQIELIFTNRDVLEVFLEPGIAPGQLDKALKNAEKQAELELNIKKLTLPGREGIVSDAFNKAMDAFSAEERMIEIEFGAQTEEQEKIIDLAEREIASLQYMMEDYEAGLTEIQNQEEVINEAYEKRFEALDRISDINEKIAAQQQQQIDLAEALSRGDIAAAARAAQDMRNQQQRDNVDEQRKMLEQRQRIEVENLRSVSGMTRSELEDQIKSLEEQIFRIEQERIRPAEEYTRLAELRMMDEISNLRILGKTKEEWEALQAQIDQARTRNWKFMEELMSMAGIIPDLLEEYRRPKPLPAAPALPRPPAPRRRRRRRLNSRQKREAGWTNPDGTPWDPNWSGPAPSAPAPAPAPRREVIPDGAWTGNAFPDEIKRLEDLLPSPTTRASGGLIAKNLSMGGKVKGFPMGGMVPYMALGGMFKSLGSDTVPAMLTPGEFVIRRPAVNEFGADNLEKINRGTYNGGSMYNYNLQVNVKSNANPEQIANTVMREIHRIDSKRIRDNRL